MKYFLCLLMIFCARSAFAKYVCDSKCPDGFYGTCRSPDVAHEGDDKMFPCPENSPCKPKYISCFSIYCNAGYYSTGDPNEGTMECHACPKGCDCPEGTDQETMVCAGQSACTAGAAVFHAGTLSFPMWDECDGVALWFGLDGGNCCVNLAAGSAVGAVNVEYNGATYHTTD